MAFAARSAAFAAAAEASAWAIATLASASANSNCLSAFLLLADDRDVDADDESAAAAAASPLLPDTVPSVDDDVDMTTTPMCRRREPTSRSSTRRLRQDSAGRRS